MERLLGYSDEISVFAGQTIAFKVSSPSGEPYRAELVRLRCADSDAGGPGFKETKLSAAFEGEHPGRRQPIGIGSFVEVSHPEAFALASFTLGAMVFATTPGEREQALLGTYDPDRRTGFGLGLDATGAPALFVGDGRERSLISTGEPLIPSHWYLIAASYDAERGEGQIYQIPQFEYAVGTESASARRDGVAQPAPGAALRMAAWAADGLPRDAFNGKLEDPWVMSRALDRNAIERVAAAGPAHRGDGDVVASWDLAQQPEGRRVVDAGPRKLHGTTENLPTRAVRGRRWDGTEHRFTEAPDHYGAIHFHEDDLYDCQWDTDFAYEIPADLASGLYAAKLSQGSQEEYLPFYVRPAPGAARNKLALLIPTASYYAYANFHINTEWDFSEHILNFFTVLDAEAHYLQTHAELGVSTYDSHTDGSGVCFSSRLRPVINMRPHTWSWQFCADTHLLDWLEEKEIAFDVITDDDLHREGFALLEPYQCVMTGTHPEYYSRDMMNALQTYKASGGRLMYMGGNGFYWKVDYNETFPGAIEMRRAEDGSRGWLAEPGEYYNAWSGELSGLWCRNGMPPQAIGGTGFAAQGFDSSTHFRRTAASFDPRAAFIFEGVGDDEVIGNFGAMGGGAAGWEVDRADFALGTPPHALIVAEATDFSVGYVWVAEEHRHAHPAITGETCPHVRADMVFFETPNGGAVFSTSSIAWSGALAYADYDNNVSRITENVVRRFLDPKPF